MGTGLDQADGVGAQAAAGSAFTVSSTPVQIQHVAQGLPTGWSHMPASAAWRLRLQGLHEGQGGDSRQWGLVCSLGKGHSKEEEEEEAGERVGHSHDR